VNIRTTDCLLTALNRDALLKLLPRGRTGIEIGVNRGAYSKKILETTQPSVLHLVDPWPVDSQDDYIRTYGVRDDMQVHYEMVCSDFAAQIAERRVVVHRAYSRDCAAAFAGGSIDFVYVDGMHSYEACLEDLRLYGPKVRGTGLLLGHDFSNTDMGRRKGFGVIRAVAEFVAESDFKPVMVTLENAPSYVLARHGGTRDALIARALELAPGIVMPFDRLVTMEQVPVTLARRTAQVARFG